MRGNVARFINHSCGPNCYAKTVFARGKNRVLIFAKRDIAAGEEVVYDYMVCIGVLLKTNNGVGVVFAFTDCV